MVNKYYEDIMERVICVVEERLHVIVTFELKEEGIKVYICSDDYCKLQIAYTDIVHYRDIELQNNIAVSWSANKIIENIKEQIWKDIRRD